MYLLEDNAGLYHLNLIYISEHKELLSMSSQCRDVAMLLKQFDWADSFFQVTADGVRAYKSSVMRRFSEKTGDEAEQITTRVTLIKSSTFDWTRKPLSWCDWAAEREMELKVNCYL